MENKQSPDPFGYFKPEPFGWTDCAETDDDAIPLYDKATILLIEKQRDELLAALNEALECGEDGDWQSARRVISAAIASVKGGA